MRKLILIIFCFSLFSLLLLAQPSQTMAQGPCFSGPNLPLMNKCVLYLSLCASDFKPAYGGNPPGCWCTCEPITDQVFCDDEGNEVNTALGCLPVDERFVPWAISRAVMVGGGVAFLLMLYAGFQIITSAGNPQQLQAGQQLLTAAISGLLLIIFSIFLLRFIGVEILDIPGL